MLTCFNYSSFNLRSSRFLHVRLQNFHLRQLLGKRAVLQRATGSCVHSCHSPSGLGGCGLTIDPKHPKTLERFVYGNHIQNPSSWETREGCVSHVRPVETFPIRTESDSPPRGTPAIGSLFVAVLKKVTSPKFPKTSKEHQGYNRNSRYTMGYPWAITN